MIPQDSGQKNITDRWMDLIYNSLERLQVYNLRMLSGCVDLQEYIDSLVYKVSLAQVCYKNAGLMLDELGILLSNVKEILKQEDFDNISSKLTFLKKLYSNELNIDGTDIKIYQYIHSVRNKTSTFTLTGQFKHLSNDLSNIRENIISLLKNILYLKGNRGNYHV